MRLKYERYSISRGVQKIKTRTAVVLSAVALSLSGGTGLSLAVFGSAHAATPDWNVNGVYNFEFEYLGSPYVHQVTLSGQDVDGNFNVVSTYPVGGPEAYAWSGTGSISGSALTMSTDYTVGAVGTHMDITGTVASNGTLSGSWSDNNIPGGRTGTWESVSGSAHHIASQVIVTPPVNSQGWSTADTRPGGAVNFVSDSTAPGNPHIGALQLTTDATTAAKAQYLHAANTPLSDVTELSYSTKQNSASFVGGEASFQLVTCLTGAPTATTCPGFTTLVYEPYQGGQGAVLPGQWQSWDMYAGGLFWSSRAVTCSDGAVVAGAGGPAIYTLAQIKTMCPDAVAAGFGVNVGTFNPSYNVETDLVNFNNTTYNFEPYVVAGDKEACKKDGWKNLATATGQAFKNQGQCVAYTNHN